MGLVNVPAPKPLDALLTQARLTTYLAATGGDLTSALEMYDWNADISGAFITSVHYLEIGLRNSLDIAAMEHLGGGWLESNRLKPRSAAKVRSARQQAGGTQASHGKVVAELTFGFWVSLLAVEYNRRLWQPAFRFAFALPVQRGKLHHDLDEVRQLRNRVAHHEPIFQRDLAADYDRILNTAERISPALECHIAARSRIPALLLIRPD